MRVDKKIFHFPPYISTKWSLVSSLHVEENILTVTLTNGKTITIPHLDEEQMTTIFSAHEEYLEEPAPEQAIQEGEALFKSFGKLDKPFQMEIANLEEMGAAMQHNPSQMQAPNLPTEVLEKISGLANLFAPDDSSQFPEPEPHCNCPHCQIARAIHMGAEPENQEEIAEEEEVSDEELQFQQWNITQKNETLYSVTNKINQEETYSVHLGNPVGCTCGKEGCEHIVAVLKT